ncbi:MAG TPA: prenyltransferase [Patescibacteria group bacterium]|nr:prenyltransferase [Patescibacteria group bacterium]
MSGSGVLIRVIRPHIVAGGFLGYTLGVLLAFTGGAEVNLPVFALGYTVVLLGDLSTHFSNDYYDADLDQNAPRKTFGSSYTLVHHPDLRQRAMTLALAFSSASIIMASTLVLLFGSPMILLTLVAITNLVGWLYSMPPIKLNARGLGEVIIALGTGFAVPAVGYIVVSGTIDRSFLTFSAPLILYGIVLSLSLELPDREVDREAGRMNLVVKLGRRKASSLALLLSVASSAYLSLLLDVPGGDPSTILALSLIPVAACINGALKPQNDHKQTDGVSALNVYALSLFLAALNVHLLLGLK